MRCDVIRTPDELRRMEPEWDALWRRAPGATPFQSPHWLLPWQEHFGGEELYTVVVRGDDGLAALAPLYIVRDDESDESLGLFLGTGVSDYLDALADGATAEEIVRVMGAADCQMWDLQQLRPSSPLLAPPAPEGWTASHEPMVPCPVLALGSGAELGSTHFRKKLRYYRRALERAGEVSYESASEENLDELLGALYELHAARWRARGQDGVLADAVIQRFHRDAARRMLGAGALRMHAIRLAGRIVAIFYGFAHQGTTYYYLSGYDPSLEKLSIGTLIVAQAVEQALAQGGQTFDFLRGAEEYKYAWGAEDRMNQRRMLIRG